MFQISHEENILWQVRWEYQQLPKEVYSRYVFDHYQEFTRVSKEQWDYIHQAYYYCTQVWKVYNESFKEFEKYIQRTYNPYQKFWRRSLNWGNRNYKKSSYRRKPHHEKKILSEKEIARREWKEKKQFSRDKANKYYTRGPKKFFKKIANREHRQWVKQNIHHGRWDMNNKDYKIFCDPWRYD